MTPDRFWKFRDEIEDVLEQATDAEQLTVLGSMLLNALVAIRFSDDAMAIAAMARLHERLSVLRETKSAEEMRAVALAAADVGSVSH